MKLTNKILALLVVFSLFGTQKLKAQAAFEEGKSYASIGYGYQLLSVKSLFKSVTTGVEGIKTTGLGPIVFKYEYAVSKKIGIGISGAYTASSISWTDNDAIDPNGNSTTYNYKYKYSKFTFTPRLNIHLTENEKIDPYVGFGLGFKKASFSLDTNDPTYTDELDLPLDKISMEASFGCRFLFTEQIGAFVELGVGHGFFQGGVVAKF
jgi:opacity protein-like surface antigen